jgi:hypothetical protein
MHQKSRHYWFLLHITARLRSESAASRELSIFGNQQAFSPCTGSAGRACTPPGCPTAIESQRHAAKKSRVSGGWPLAFLQSSIATHRQRSCKDWASHDSLTDLALKTAVAANIVGITEATRLRETLPPEGFAEVDAELNSGELHFLKETE